jgi:hypothetical protein
MKNNWIFATLLAFTITPFAVFAQGQPLSNNVQASPNPPILAGVQKGDAAELADVLAVQPSAPLGPPDLLKEYEQAMAATAQGFSTEVQQIAAAVQQNKITEDEGEYLCSEAYQLAMMQFQAFSGLHDMLQEEVSQTAAQQRPATAAPESAPSGSDYHTSVGTAELGSKKI